MSEPTPETGPQEPEYVAVRPTDAPAAGEAALPPAAQGVVEVEGAAPQRRGGQTTVWLFRKGEELRTVGLAETPALTQDDDNFLWVSLVEFTAPQLQKVADLLHLDPGSVRKALGPWQRPRVEVRGDGYFVMATVPRIDPDAYLAYAGQLNLFVGRNFLVGADQHPPVFAGQVLERARQNPERLREDSSFLLYIILDELLGYYEGLVEHLSDEVERTEERALSDTSERFLADLLRLKRYAYALGRLAEQHRPVLAAFLRPEFPFDLPELILPYYRELQERLGEVLTAFAGVKESVNGAFDTYVSHVAHRTNDVMRALTLISGLLLPATVMLTLLGTHAQVVQVYGTPGMVIVYVTTLLAFAASVLTFRVRGWFGLKRPGSPADAHRRTGPDAEETDRPRAK